jgi:acyl-CoA synthetase (AMP-forming)/AMP-acid ligase II
MFVTEILDRARNLYPRKTGVVCGDETFTYAQLGERVDRLSGAFIDLGLKKGDRIAILHRNCHRYLESYFSALHAGMVLCPLNYRLSPHELTVILNDNQAKILIVERCFAPQVQKILPCVRYLQVVMWSDMDGGGLCRGIEEHCYESLFTAAAFQPSKAHSHSSVDPAHLAPPTGAAERDTGIGIDCDDMINLYYTSGTTGRQKGVMLSHRNVYCHAMSTIAELNLTDADVWIHVAPMFHLADAWATWAITWVGGTHTFVSDFDPDAVLRTMERERVTVTNMIPMMLNILVNCSNVQRYDLSSLRLVLSGGAPIAPEVVRKIMATFRCDYIQTYGLTETSPYLTMSILKHTLKTRSEEEQFRFKASTGRPVLGVSLRVVDERGEEVNHDGREAGEILVRGDVITGGYWNLHEETRSAFSNGWLRTGDLATIDEEGYVNIVDRKKDMIVTGGENVYSTEVEHVLYMHPSVLEAAVIGVPDDTWGEAVKAVVVLKDDEKAGEEEIITFCRDHIAGYKVPRSIDFAQELPRTGSGKIYKKGLREKYWKGKDKKVS